MSKKTIAFNKRAAFQYEIKEKFQAGILLLGSEVKSLRAGLCHLKDSYIAFRKSEAFLQKAYIGPYPKALKGGHDPERKRKLLLNKRELDRIRGLVEQKKLACIPTEIYFQKGLVKLEIALAVGKSKFDKRQSLKKKQAKRQIQRALKQKRP